MPLNLSSHFGYIKQLICENLKIEIIIRTRHKKKLCQTRNPTTKFSTHTISLSLSPPLSLYLNLCINYASCVYNHSCYLALFSVLWISITNASLLCKCKITSYFYEIFKCWCICFSFFSFAINIWFGEHNNFIYKKYGTVNFFSVCVYKPQFWTHSYGLIYFVSLSNLKI